MKHVGLTTLTTIGRTTGFGSDVREYFRNPDPPRLD